jgi:MFS family permease
VSWSSSLPVMVTPGLSTRVWLLQAGVALNFFGNGLVGPFLVIYLHFFRGIPFAFAGLAIGAGGVVATISGLLAGTLIDRFGARRCLSAAMTCNGIAYAAYTQVHTTPEAFLVGSVVGLGTGAYGPCVQTLLSSLVRPDQRAGALSQQRMSAMVGLGLGGLVGGVIAAGGRTDDFVLLLLLDAGTFVGFALLASRLPNPTARREKAGGGYRAVIRDRRLSMLAAINLLMVGGAIAPMLVVLPAFAKVQAHVPATAIGLIYALNTAVILVSQLTITRAVAGRAPMRMLSLAAGLWSASWSLVLASGIWLDGWIAASVIAAGMLIYALGECIYTAIVTPTAASMAPDALRGRYLAVMGFAWQAGFMVGPAGGGFLIGRSPLAFPAIAAAMCIALAVLLPRFRLDPTDDRPRP